MFKCLFIGGATRSLSEFYVPCIVVGDWVWASVLHLYFVSEI